MPRHPQQYGQLPLLKGLTLAWLTLLPTAGCHHLLATGIYIWEGGNTVDAEYKDLEEKRVVVVCRPPASSEYSHAGASRQVARAVGSLLQENVRKVTVVDPREVDDWLDESDSGDYTDLGRAVKADRVLVVELEHFDLFKGKTLYQGNAAVSLAVYDMETGGNLVWDRHMGDVLFPRNSGIPAQDKSLRQFQRDYVGILSQQIAVHFYKHDPHASFAIDALANR